MQARSPAEVASRITSIVGGDRVRAPLPHEARAAGVVVEPADTNEVAEIVRACETDGIALAPIAAARTLAEIRSIPVVLGISLNRLRRVLAYEPADMTITVEAGLSVGELNRTTETTRQRLPVDPPNPDATTVGALIAASHSGPLHLSEGTVRDLLIGIRYVGHGGRLTHGGGRVVKNVAGYDLMKVMGGSFGTLGIIVEATFKMRPTPEHYTMAIAVCDSAGEAFAAARQLGDSLPLAHLEVLSGAAAQPCKISGKLALIAGISGSLSEVTYERGEILRLVPKVTFVEQNEALGIYSRLRDFNFASVPIVAQVAVPPAELAVVLSATGAEFIAHAGSGVAKIFFTDAPADARVIVARWRELARNARGHLRVIHCEPPLRSEVEFFDTPNAGALALMSRLKAAFDPAGIFNPGCFVGGI